MMSTFDIVQEFCNLDWFFFPADEKQTNASMCSIDKRVSVGFGGLTERKSKTKSIALSITWLSFYATAASS